MLSTARQNTDEEVAQLKDVIYALLSTVGETTDQDDELTLVFAITPPTSSDIAHMRLVET